MLGPECPDNASADQVFEYFLQRRAYLLNYFIQDPRAFLDTVDTLLARDDGCMSTGEDLHRRIRSELRCQGCCTISKLVDDDERQIGKPFTIQTGDFEGRQYVLESYPLGEKPLIYCQRGAWDVVEVVLTPFYHVLLTGFILEAYTTADLGNEVMGGYACTAQGILLRRLPSTQPVKIAFTRSLVWFMDYLHRLLDEADLVHYLPGIGFNNRSSWIQVFLTNTESIELRTGSIRLLTHEGAHARQGHPTDVNGFHGGERLWQLFDHKQLRTPFAKVLTAYYLITLLLLTGQWLPMTRVRVNLEVLYGKKGLTMLESVKQMPSNVRPVLDFTEMGAARLHEFFAEVALLV